MSDRKSLIDKILDEARKKGIYNPTDGAARPLDISDDSMVPEQDRMGYHLLKSNGFAPPFIEERNRLREDARQLLADRDALQARWQQLSPPQQQQQRTVLRNRFIDLWRRTLDYNLQAPASLHIDGIRVEYELSVLDVGHALASDDSDA
jgi:DnaJ family protein C protein 28